MIRKYHNHKPQTTLWYPEEESLNHHKTPGRQIKQSCQLSLPHQDDCNTRTDTKQRTTNHRTITDSNNGSNNKQNMFKPSSIFLTGRSKAVLLLWIIFCYLCFVLYCLVCSWESADLLALLYVMFTCILSLSHMVSWVRCGI